MKNETLIFIITLLLKNLSVSCIQKKKFCYPTLKTHGDNEGFEQVNYLF